MTADGTTPSNTSMPVTDDSQSSITSSTAAGLAAALTGPSFTANPFQGMDSSSGFGMTMQPMPGAAADANSGNAEQEEQQHVSRTAHWCSGL